jgi:4-hydroxy-tetrahydrodipicolinate synthase
MNLMADLSKAVMDQGAAGVMIAPTPTLKTDEQIFRYFEQCVALLGDTPICLQDYPQTLGVHFSVPLLVKIFKALPSICMLKHEDAPGLTKLSAFRAACESEIDRRVSILVGNGGIYLPQEMARGADGAMTGFAFPEMLVQVVEMFAKGQAAQGEDLFDAYLPLVRHELQPGIGLAIRKYVLKERGAIAHDFLRAPGPSLDATGIAEVRALWDRLDRRLQSI